VTMQPSLTSLSAVKAEVTIGKLDLKISGTAASILYNLVLAAFKKMIKSTIEKELSELVRSAINDSAQDLMSAF